MFGKLKRIAILAVVVFALSALGASPAFAEGELTADEYPATLATTALAHTTFKIKGKQATCKVEHFKATLNAKTDITTFESEYTGCTHLFGMTEFPMTIDMNGCDWDLYVKLQWFYLECPAGKEPKLTFYSSAEQHQKKTALCEVTVPPQGEIGNIEYENTSGSPEKVWLGVNLTGIEYTLSGTPLFCGENGTFSDGEVTTEVVVSAKNEAGEPIDLMVD